MTTYAYDLTLEESEVIMLEAALKLIIERSETNMANGEGAPNWARKHYAEKVLARLHGNTRQTSGNNFF